MAYDAQYVAEVLNYKAGDFSTWPEVSTRRFQMPIAQKYWPNYYKDNQVWFYQTQDPVDDIELFQVMSNRGHMPNVGESSGADRNVVSRTAHWTSRRAPTRSMKLVYCNSFLTTTGEANGPNTIFVTSSIEYNGIIYPVYFSLTREKPLTAGQVFASDAVLVSIPPNTQFWTRQNVRTANATEKFKTGYTARTDLGEGTSITTALAQVDLPGALTTPLAAAAMYSPVAVLGSSIESRPPSVVIIGSSSAFGQGETFATIPAPADRGYLARTVTNNFGQVVLATGSLTLAQFITASALRTGIMTAVNPTHVICQLGQNDITGGATAATVQSRLQTVWNTLSQGGLRRVIQTTITPTSTGTWTTLAGQTATFNAVRTAVNTFIKTCPTPLAGYIDACAAVESSPGSGLWRIDGGAWTADGTHTSRHAEVAAQLSVSGIIS